MYTTSLYWFSTYRWLYYKLYDAVGNSVVQIFCRFYSRCGFHTRWTIALDQPNSSLSIHNPVNTNEFEKCGTEGRGTAKPKLVTA